MKAELRSLLTGYAPLAALVGTRIFWGNFPQAVVNPAVRMNKMNGAPGHTYRGSDGLEPALVQLDIRALSPASAVDVRNAIVDRLADFSGTQGAVDFDVIRFEDERDASAFSDTENYSMIQLDFLVWHS